MGDPEQDLPSFSNFRFNTIGNISLLKRISNLPTQAQPAQLDEEEEGDEDDLYVDMDIDTPEPPDERPALLARIGDRFPISKDPDAHAVNSHPPLVPAFADPCEAKSVTNEDSGSRSSTREHSQAADASMTISHGKDQEHAAPTLLQEAPLPPITPIPANGQKYPPSACHLSESSGSLLTPPPSSSVVAQDFGPHTSPSHRLSTPPLYAYPSLEQLLQEERSVWSEAAELKHNRAGLGLNIDISVAPHGPAPQSTHDHPICQSKVPARTPTNQDKQVSMDGEVLPVNSSTIPSQDNLMLQKRQHEQTGLLPKPTDCDGHNKRSSSIPSHAISPQVSVVNDNSSQPQVSSQPASATAFTPSLHTKGSPQLHGKAGGCATKEITLSIPRPDGQSMIQSTTSPESRSPREEELKTLLKSRKIGHGLDPCDTSERSRLQHQQGPQPCIPLKSPSMRAPLPNESRKSLDPGATSTMIPCRDKNDPCAAHVNPTRDEVSERPTPHTVHAFAVKRKASQLQPPLNGADLNPITKRLKTSGGLPQNHTTKTTFTTSDTMPIANLISSEPPSGIASRPQKPTSVPWNSSSTEIQIPLDSTIQSSVAPNQPERVVEVERAKGAPSPSTGINEAKASESIIPRVKAESLSDGASWLDVKSIIKVKKEEPDEILIRVKVEEDLKNLTADLQTFLSVDAIPLKKEERGDDTFIPPRIPPSPESQEHLKSIRASRVRPENASSHQQRSDEPEAHKTGVSENASGPDDRNPLTGSVQTNTNTPVQQEDPSELVLAHDQMILHRPSPVEASGTRVPLLEHREYEPGRTVPASPPVALVSPSRSRSREEPSRQRIAPDRQSKPNGMTSEVTRRPAGRDTRQQERSREPNPRLIDHWSPPRDRAPFRTRPTGDTYRPPPSPPEHYGRIARGTLNVHRRDFGDDSLAQRRGDRWLPSDEYTPHPQRRSRSASPRRTYRNHMRHSPSPPPRQPIVSEMISPNLRDDRCSPVHLPIAPHNLHDERVGLSANTLTSTTQPTDHLTKFSRIPVDDTPSVSERRNQRPTPVHHATVNIAQARLEDGSTDLLHGPRHVSKGPATRHNEPPIAALSEQNLGSGFKDAAARESKFSIPRHDLHHPLSSTKLASSQLPPSAHSSEQDGGLTNLEISIKRIVIDKAEEQVHDIEDVHAEDIAEGKQVIESTRQIHGESSTNLGATSMQKSQQISDPPLLVSGYPSSFPLPPQKRPDTFKTQRSQPHFQPGENSSQPSSEVTAKSASHSLVQRIGTKPTKQELPRDVSDSEISLDPSPPHSPNLETALPSRIEDPYIHDESSQTKNCNAPTPVSPVITSLESRITDPGPSDQRVTHPLPPKPDTHRKSINLDIETRPNPGNDHSNSPRSNTAPRLLKRLNVAESDKQESDLPSKSQRGGRGAMGRGRGRGHIGDHYSPRGSSRNPRTRSKPSLGARLS